MGIFDRVEHGLEAVHGAFAKAFKSEVQPVEIAAAIRRAMDDRAAVLGHGPRHRAQPLHRSSSADRLRAARRLRGGPRGRPRRRRPGARRLAALPARRPDRGHSSRARTSRPGSSGSARRPRDRVPAQPAIARAAAAGAGRPSAAPPAPSAGTGSPPAATARARSAADPAPTPRRTPAPAAPGQPGRPALARHRRRALPAAGRASPSLGRDDTADIILDDPGISRRHSEIRVTTDGPHLVAQHPRPRLDQRHLRQRRADHEPAARGRRPGHRRPHHVTFRAGRR